MSRPPLPEPVYHQWRRKNIPWSLEFAFDSMCHATTDDSEVRTLHPAEQMHAYADTVLAAARDCRTCYNMRRNETCDAFKPCTDADRYEPLPPIKLWRKSE